jgi:hypothetical protein
MHLARRPMSRFALSNFGSAASVLCIALTGAALASSCLLNPHPAPPSEDDDSPPPAAGRGGRGGADGFGGAGGTGVGVGGAGGGLAGASGASGAAGNISFDAGAGAGGGSGGAGGPADAGGDASDAGGDAGPNTGPCRTVRDCALDSICSAETGTCTPIPQGDCSPPVNEGGQVPKLGTCSLASPCSEGLTCVPLGQVLGSTGAYESGPTGVCLSACNPCVPLQCALNETCFARTPGRGFCGLSLVAEGAPCGYAVTPAPCAAGLTCAEVFDQAGRTCVRYCRPEGAPNLSSNDSYSASTSPDCRAGEVCFETRSGSQATATDYACVAGTLVDDAGACGGNRFCKPPARCVAGVCTP